jgi:CheY-like chemotaxis protein
VRILFVDDEPAHAQIVLGLLRTVLDARTEVVSTVGEAVEALKRERFDLLITDLFLPMGPAPANSLGPRARRFGEQHQHLGGLVLLDELDRLGPGTPVLIHTASTDRAVLDACGPLVRGRIFKPAGAEDLLRASMEALDLPVPGL